ncbi:hypothetical protein D3C71_1871490 [compost metagenome]
MLPEVLDGHRSCVRLESHNQQHDPGADQGQNRDHFDQSEPEFQFPEAFYR